MRERGTKRDGTDLTVVIIVCKSRRESHEEQYGAVKALTLYNRPQNRFSRAAHKHNIHIVVQTEAP